MPPPIRLLFTRTPQLVVKVEPWHRGATAPLDGTGDPLDFVRFSDPDTGNE